MKTSQEAMSIDSLSTKEQSMTESSGGEWVEPAKQKKNIFLSVFASTFITIFLAELGDKTQLTTLLMSAQSHSPWVVFAGAATALIATSLIGVVLGQWLAKWLSPKTLTTAAGVTMLLISVGLLWDVLR